MAPSGKVRSPQCPSSQANHRSMTRETLRRSANETTQGSYRLFSYMGRPTIAAPATASSIKASIRCLPQGTLRGRLYALGVKMSVATGLTGLTSSRVTIPLPTPARRGILRWLEQQCSGSPVDTPHYLTVIWPSQPNRRRVYVHVIDQEGHHRCFIKLSLDHVTDGLLLREATQLAKIGSFPRRHFNVPRVLGVIAAGPRIAIALSPLPYANTTSMTPREYPHDAVAEYAGSASSLPTGDLSWLDPGNKPWMRSPSFRAEIESHPPSWRVATAHGDLGPHNMMAESGQLWIFDWESCTADAPVLTDRVGYALSTVHRRLLRKPSRWRTILERESSGIELLPRVELMQAIAFRASKGIRDAEAIIHHWDKSEGWGTA
jgi:hypothetical protein